MIFKHCVLDLSVQLKRISLEFFSSTPFEDEQLIQRFERSVEVKTFYLWSIWVSADFEQWRASAARVKNPRLCNPIKVTGFISPDLTFSASSRGFHDFAYAVILLFSSHYECHAQHFFFR